MTKENLTDSLLSFMGLMVLFRSYNTCFPAIVHLSALEIISAPLLIYTGKNRIFARMVIITGCFLILYSFLILYYRKNWINLPEYTAPPLDSLQTPLPFVSIIIPARNEAKNIGACIEAICRQAYPAESWEVIIIDDHSEDETASIVKSFKNRNIHLISLAGFTGIEKINSYKKKSIETALTVAKGSIIVTTDADCVAPERWLQTMVSFYLQKDPVFIAAPVSYVDLGEKAGFFTKCLTAFQRLDFMTLQGITGASVFSRFHNMCNGANLAYEKAAFYQVGGFSGIDDIASGDDMLLMHKVSEKYPRRVHYLKSVDTIVETKPAATLAEFLQQRIRWASKSNRYPDIKITSVLLLVYLLNVWLLLIGIYAFFSAPALVLLISAIILKTIIELFFLLPVAAFFNQKKLLWAFLPAQPFHILYTVLAGTLGSFGTYQWKGRKVK